MNLQILYATCTSQIHNSSTLFLFTTLDTFVMDCEAGQNKNVLEYTQGGGNEDFIASRLRFMREETALVGFSMIQNIAKLIGMKYSVLLCDACISDLYESLSTRIQMGYGVDDIGHSKWIEKNFGIVVIVNEVSDV